MRSRLTPSIVTLSKNKYSESRLSLLKELSNDSATKKDCFSTRIVGKYGFLFTNPFSFQVFLLSESFNDCNVIGTYVVRNTS